MLLTSNYLDGRAWMLAFFEYDQRMCFGWLHGAGGCHGESGSPVSLDGSAVVISG